MVKGLKTFYLDIEVLQELKKIKNSSTLINTYLRSYFSIASNLEKEELQVKAEEAKELAAVFEAKIEELNETNPQSIPRPDLSA